MGNDFHIDKVTECIEEVSTGKIFDTHILRVTREDLKAVLKKNGWNFPWKSYVRLEERHVYKLVKTKDPAQEIQGLLSFQIMSDFIEMHHVENAPHNIGGKKQYAGVCANMVAFACKVSFDLKFEGFVGFLAKTALIDHYKNTLGASQVFNTARMIIYPEAARILVNRTIKIISVATRKKYYSLDDAGVVGTAKERSSAEIKSDAKRTSDLIKSYHASSGKVSNGSAYKNRSASSGKTKAAVPSAAKKKVVKLK